MQGIEERSRRERRRLREFSMDVLGADRAQIGDLSAPQHCERFARNGFTGGDVIIGHDTRLLSINASSSVRVHSLSFMLMLFTVRSGCGRARSTDKRPFFKSAPRTSIPSASTKHR